jgi:hypothetical protein
MTLADTRQILGEPQGTGRDLGQDFRRWMSNRLIIDVFFDSGDCVLDRDVCDTELSYVDMLCVLLRGESPW